MKSLFSNILKLSAISAIALCGFCGCSDDGSSGTAAQQDVTPNNNAPADPIREESDTSPIRINKMSISSNGLRTSFIIGGGAVIDQNDTVSVPKGAEAFFMNMQMSVSKIVNGELKKTPLTVTCQGAPCALTSPVQTINLTEMGARIEDNNKSDCGEFRITISYAASYDLADPEKFISNDFIDFTREQTYCEEEKQPEQQVNPADLVTLTSYEVVVNTKKGDGLSLATGATVPAAQADLIFASDDLSGEISITTSNGAKITPYSNDGDNNYDDDWNIKTLPPDPVHMSDFRFRATTLSTGVGYFDSFIFYVVTTPNYNAETGDGFYAFTAKKVGIADENKNIQVTLLVYKK